MDVFVEEMPAYQIAYLRKTGPYGASNAQAMEELKAWAGVNRLLSDDSIILGIAWDNPETTSAESCRYDACIVVSNTGSIACGHVGKGDIIGGKYAVFIIEHTAEAVQKAWVDIFPELSNRGFQFDDARPIIERYKAQMIKNHQCEICVPIIEG